MRYQLLIATLLTLTVLLGTKSTHAFEGNFSFTQANTTVFFSSQIELAQGETLLATTWEFGDGESSVHANPVHPYSSFGSYECCLEVKVELADGSICLGEVCQQVNLIDAAPCALEVSFAASKLPDGLVQFEALTDANAFTTLEALTWDFGDGSSEENIVPELHQYTEPGSYLACVSSEASSYGNTCADIFCQTIDIEPFDCAVKAQIDVVTTTCGIHATYDDNVLGWSSVESMQWTVNGMEESESDFIAMGANDGDVLEVCLAVVASSPGSTCQHTDCRELVVSCGEDNDSDDKKDGGPVMVALDKSSFGRVELTVFPNPAQDSFTVQTDDLISVSIHDLTGKEVYSGADALIDCSLWMPGVYLIRVHTQSGDTTSRMIKS